MRSQSLRFVDGTSQRYRDYRGPVRQWEIRLDQLDEGEIAVLDRFFRESQGRFGNFAFTDPWDGQVYPNCSFADDALGLLSVEDLKGRTSFRVRENRG